LSELNLVNIVNRFTDNKAFVISTDASSDPFEFSIGGYYFSASIAAIKALLTTNNRYLNASISLTAGELNGIDNGGSYEGIVFTQSTAPVGTSKTSLCLLHRVSASSYVIPEDSKIKFESQSIGSIDGGEI
jgi:hypothetical protein